MLSALAGIHWLVESINNLFLHYLHYCAAQLLVRIDLSAEMTFAGAAANNTHFFWALNHKIYFFSFILRG